MSIPVRRRNLVVLQSPPKTRKDSGPSVDQLKLETILGMRRQLRELEESIGVALAKGAHVEPGIHTAQLVPERRRGEFFMKLIILAALCAVLPSIVFSQGQVSSAALPTVQKMFALPGGVSLEIKKDEMTDRRVCSLVTPLWGVYTSFNGESIAIWTSDSIDVDYNQPALLRIAETEPIELTIPRRPHLMLVPPRLTGELVRALYVRDRVRLRFSRYPGGDSDNVDLEIGDFAAGYDLGVDLCAWPKPPLKRIPLSDEPVVKRSADGDVDVEVAGRHGWGIHSSSLGRCTFRAPFGSMASRHDRRTFTSFLGSLTFYDAKNKTTSVLSSFDRGPQDLIAFARAADTAGADGTVEVSGQKFSLYGFRSAAKVASETCGFEF